MSATYVYTMPSLCLASNVERMESVVRSESLIRSGTSAGGGSSSSGGYFANTELSGAEVFGGFAFTVVVANAILWPLMWGVRKLPGFSRVL